MKRLAICFLGFCFYLPHMHCQEKTDSVAITKNAAYLELGGNSATMFSVHYDRIIKQMKRSYLNIGLGFGYFPAHDVLHNNIGVPVSVNYTNRLYKKNHLEMGVGLTYSYGTFQYRNSENEVVPYEALFGCFRIGYKYQNPEKAMFFKAGFTPLVEIYRFSNEKNQFGKFLPFAGLAVGYSF